MSQAFYLKYRPQTFADLDSSLAREELIRIFSSGKIPHAFLFSGTKGIGKTSAARIVAKAVNCERVSEVSKVSKVSKGEKGNVGAQRAVPEDFEPCNKCGSCISITNGSNVDVLEIDAASNRGIDDIRELRDKIRLSPASSKYKVYIIDEVHMLSTEAFNALLKTLEEPPRHAIFVLCTTDPEKLPKTIVSRCQRINFKKATQKEITERLEKICLEEKFEFEKEALAQISKFSEGSFRDGVKVLEQVSFNGKISLEAVEKTIGISANFKIADFLQMLKKKETKEALDWLGAAVEQGVNLRFLAENLLDQLRVCLLENFSPAVNEAEIKFSVEEAKKLIEIFSKAYLELKFAPIPQLPLEVAVIEWGGLQCKIDEGESGDKVISSGSEKSSEASMVEDFSPRQGGVRNDKIGNFSLDDVLQKWPEILEKVKPLNHSVLAFLRACRPKSCENGCLTLEVFYKFHKDQLESEKSRRIFEQAAGEVLNSPVRLKCDLSDGKPEKLPPAPLPPIGEKKTVVKTKKAEEDDIIKVAEEIFNK